MNRKLIGICVACVSPFLARAAGSRGTCEFASEDPGEAKLTFCVHVTDEARCRTEALKKGSFAFVDSHPPKYTPGADCTDSDNSARKAAEQKKSAKPSKKATSANAGKASKDPTGAE